MTKGKDKAFKLKISLDRTMFDLKMKIEELTKVPVHEQYLTCLRKQKLLDAENKFQLREFGIEDEDSLFLGVWELGERISD